MLGRARQALIALLIAGLSYVAASWWDFTVPSLGEARYQAVFLTNGQAYFGHFRDRIGPYARVDDAYYIQTQEGETSADGTAQPPGSKLVRRGVELHAPRQPFYVAKSAIVFVEDVGSASEIAKFMDQDAHGRAR